MTKQQTIQELRNNWKLLKLISLQDFCVGNTYVAVHTAMKEIENVAKTLK